MASATFSVTNSTLDDNNLFKTDFVCEIAGASPYQDCQMQLSYYSPSAQGDVSLDSVYGTADGEGNAVLIYHLDGNRDIGGETLASIIFPSNSSTTSIRCVAIDSAEVIGFERFTLTLDAPPIFSDVTISSNFVDGVYVQGMTTINVSAKIEPRFGSSVASAAVYLTDSVGGSEHLGMAYSTASNKWFGHVNVTYDIHSGNALLSIQTTSGRGIYNHNIAEIIVKEHAYPSVTVDCFRCDSNGDRDMNGDHISVTAYAASVPVELGISILRGRIYPYPGPEEPVVYTNLTNGVPTLFEEASLSPDGTITADEIISPDKGYKVVVVASDGYYTSTKEIVIPPVKRIINVKDGGTGIAFGKLATEDALLDTDWIYRTGKSGSGDNAGVQVRNSTANTDTEVLTKRDDTGNGVSLLVGSGGNNRGLYNRSDTGAGWIMYLGSDGEVHFGKPVSPTNLPEASASQAGIVSTDTQTFAGQKTFNNRIIANASSTGDGATGSIVAQGGNPSIVSNNTVLGKYIELIAGSSGNRGLYTGDGWVLYLGGDGKIHFGKPVDATNLPVASATEAGIVSTDDQVFAGTKRFNGNAFFYANTVVANENSGPRLKFRPEENTDSNDYGWIFLNTPATNGVNRTDRFYLRQYSYNSTTGARTGGYDQYRLPVVTPDITSANGYDILTSKSAVTIAQGGTGQTGQTAQQSYTPTVKIGTTAQTVSSLSAYYKSWGLMKLIGGRFNLTTTGTGSLVISLPTGFTVPTSAVQPMGILIAPDQKAYHIRVTADGLSAMSNGGGSVTWATGLYCFWAVVMGN